MSKQTIPLLIEPSIIEKGFKNSLRNKATIAVYEWFMECLQMRHLPYPLTKKLKEAIKECELEFLYEEDFDNKSVAVLESWFDEIFKAAGEYECGTHQMLRGMIHYNLNMVEDVYEDSIDTYNEYKHYNRLWILDKLSKKKENN